MTFPLVLYYKKVIFMGGQLIYNLVLVSGVQQSEAVMHIIYPFFFRLFPHVAYYRILSRVPCAMQ